MGAAGNVLVTASGGVSFILRQNGTVITPGASGIGGLDSLDNGVWRVNTDASITAFAADASTGLTSLGTITAASDGLYHDGAARREGLLASRTGDLWVPAQNGSDYYLRRWDGATWNRYPASGALDTQRTFAVDDPAGEVIYRTNAGLYSHDTSSGTITTLWSTPVGGELRTCQRFPDGTFQALVRVPVETLDMYHLDVDGSELDYIPGTQDNPRDICIDAEGGLWGTLAYFSGVVRGQVYRMGTDGSVIDVVWDQPVSLSGGFVLAVDRGPTLGSLVRPNGWSWTQRMGPRRRGW